MPTLGWGSGLSVPTADVLGYKAVRVCLDEEGNLDNCNIREVDVDVDNDLDCISTWA